MGPVILCIIPIMTQEPAMQAAAEQVEVEVEVEDARDDVWPMIRVRER